MCVNQALSLKSPDIWGLVSGLGVEFESSLECEGLGDVGVDFCGLKILVLEIDGSMQGFAGFRISTFQSIPRAPSMQIIPTSGV